MQLTLTVTYRTNSSEYVTLIVEEKEIHFNAYLLTNNSLVFEAMLNSSFKKGQTGRIFLPGKKFKDIIYYLQFLHYSSNGNK